MNFLRKIFSNKQNFILAEKKLEFSEIDLLKNPDKYDLNILKELYSSDPWLCNRAINTWEYATGKIELTSKPLIITLPIASNICNANCVVCHEKFTEKATFLDAKNLVTLYGEIIKYTTNIGLVSMGETLLNPHLGKVIEQLSELRDPRSMVYVTTNGILLKEKFESLKKGVSTINITLNSLSNEIYDKIMRPKDSNALEKVISGIKTAISYRDSVKDAPRVNLISVLTSINLQDIKGIIDFGNEMNVDSIQLNVLHRRKVSVFTRGCEMFPEYDELLPERHKDYLNLKSDIETASLKSKVKVSILTSRILDSLTEKSCCSFPYKVANFLEIPSFVQPCCFMTNELPSKMDYPKYGTGVDFFKEIWNGDFYKTLRKSLVSAELWETCKECLNTEINP